VAGFVNDQAVPLVNCNNQPSCSAEDFAKNIRSNLKVKDVATWCNGQSKDDIKFTM